MWLQSPGSLTHQRCQDARLCRCWARRRWSADADGVLHTIFLLKYALTSLLTPSVVVSGKRLTDTLPLFMVPGLIFLLLVVWTMTCCHEDLSRLPGRRP